VHEIGGELHDVLPPGPRRLERRLDVPEDLDALRVEVVGADDVAGDVGRELARDEEPFEASRA
jgi:hypothetical protein